MIKIHVSVEYCYNELCSPVPVDFSNIIFLFSQKDFTPHFDSYNVE